MDPDQTAQKRRLVWIHAGRKTHYVGFVMTRLIYPGDVNTPIIAKVNTYKRKIENITATLYLFLYCR
jgi:hypothetical protein